MGVWGAVPDIVEDLGHHRGTEALQGPGGALWEVGGEYGTLLEIVDTMEACRLCRGLRGTV